MYKTLKEWNKTLTVLLIEDTDKTIVPKHEWIC